MTRLTRVLAALVVGSIVMMNTAEAQSARNGRLAVTVADQSGAVIPNAKVTIVGLDAATKGAAVAPVQTSDKGVATITGLVPGRYSIQAEFTGFDLGLLRDVRIRAGENKHIVVLPLSRMQDSVTVGRDPQIAASDAKTTFGTALTREQIEALSDDPDEMQRQLQDVAGAGAVMRIDSFEGGRLPPKAQIKAIHITRDSFAAENHFAGGLFIDIITQPGVGPLRGGGNYSLRDGAFSARNPFNATKGPERSQNYNMNFGGSLIKDKSSFSLSIGGTTSFDTPDLNVTLPGGATRAEALNLRRPRTGVNVFGNFDYALTKDQTFRFTYSQFGDTSENLGVGAYDLPERAYSSHNGFYNVRLQEAGPLGRRFFINTRLELGRSTSDAESAIEAPTFRINDASTRGGAQIAGGRDTRTFNLASDLDYVRGIHSVRTGIVLSGGRYQTDESSNYLGTYTFENNEAFLAGTPRSYTRRIGDPNILYWNLQAGFYLQDDVRVSKTLTLSPGIRYEAQTHLNDLANIGPRFGITWAPFKSGKTTLRGSWGIFYDWLGSGTYEQSLRVDGFRQRELNIANPSFPDPGDVGTLIATNRYLLGDGLQMARNVRTSLSVAQTLTPRIRVGATFADTHGSGLLRGRNLNAPVSGVRPDSAFVNIIETVGDAKARQQALSINGSVSFMTPSPQAAKQRFNWKRGSFNGGYAVSRSRNNTDGPFSPPATGTLDGEWGPAPGDVRHRVNFGINTQALRNLSAFIMVNGSSAPAYTIRTGRDDNGDLLFNDRPAGVGRNSARAVGQWAANANISYAIPFGKASVSQPGGIMVRSVEGVVAASMMPSQEVKRYRLMLSLSVQNITNHANYVGYSGTMTSPYFGKPTTVMGTRKVSFGMGFSF